MLLGPPRAVRPRLEGAFLGASSGGGRREPWRVCRWWHASTSDVPAGHSIVWLERERPVDEPPDAMELEPVLGVGLVGQGRGLRVRGATCRLARLGPAVPE